MIATHDMKRNVTILTMLCALLITQTSCGGSCSTAAKSLKKVVSSKTAGKVIKGFGRNADDVVRHVSSKTVTCTTCDGLKQVEYVDEYGNYLYTGDCPDCDGKGTVR